MGTSYLPFSVTDQPSASVIDFEDPKAVWDTLQAQFNTVSNAAIESYLETHQTMKMRISEGVMTYINRLTTMENRLTAIGKPLLRDEQRRALLRGLLPEFANIADLIREMDKDRASAIGVLINKAFCLQQRDEVKEGNSESALNVKSFPKKICIHCGRPGHLKANCFLNPESANYKPDRARAPQRNTKNRGTPRWKSCSEGAIKAPRELDNQMGKGYITFISKCLTSTPVS